MNTFSSGQMQQMQYSSSTSMPGGYGGQMGHINMARMGPGPGPGGHMGHMMQMSGPGRQHGGHLGMMGGGGRDMGGNMANMPIRAGGPSINMRMPLDPHTGRMFHQ